MPGFCAVRRGFGQAAWASFATANSLGLRKIGQVSIQPDNTQTRGKIAKIGYLLKVEEV